MTRDDKIANAINVTMVTVLAVAWLGVLGWGVAVKFARVREIYLGLSVDDRKAIFWFVTELFLMGLTVQALWKTPAWLRRRKPG